MSLLSVGEELSQALSRWLADPALGPDSVLELLQARARAINSLAADQLSDSQKRELLEQDQSLLSRLTAAMPSLADRKRGRAYASPRLPAALFVDRPM